MTIIADSPKPDRIHVDPNDDAVMRHLEKISGKSKQEILAAIDKVGANAETLEKELGCRNDEQSNAASPRNGRNSG